MRYTWFVKIRLHWCLWCKEGCVIQTHNVTLALFCLAAEKEKQVFSLSRTLTRTVFCCCVLLLCKNSLEQSCPRKVLNRDKQHRNDNSKSLLDDLLCHGRVGRGGVKSFATRKIQCPKLPPRLWAITARPQLDPVGQPQGRLERTEVQNRGQLRNFTSPWTGLEHEESWRFSSEIQSSKYRIEFILITTLLRTCFDGNFGSDQNRKI